MRILSLLLGLLLAAKSTAQGKPNIVLIMADDIGCFGAVQIRTPKIDRIAREGMLFTQERSSASSAKVSATLTLNLAVPKRPG
jgi:arylsulfatase A